MRRFFAVIGFSFVFASILAAYFSPVFSIVLICIAAVLLILSLSVKGLRKGFAFPLVALSIMLAAGSFLAHYYLDYMPTKVYDGKTVNVTAVCLDYGSAAQNSYKYDLKVKSTDIKSEKQSFKLRLLSRVPLETSPDDIITAKLDITGKYATAESDYGNGIYLSSYINDSDAVKKCGKTATSVNGFFANISQYAKTRLSDYMDEDSASLLKAFLFSDKSTLDSHISADVTKCGLNHTMAVSGMHLSIIAGTLFLLLNLLMKNRRAASIVSIAAVVLIMLTVGFRYSAIRAGIMMIIVFAGGLFGRKADGINSLGLSAFIFVLINPFAAINMSFLLSFAAVFGMIVIYAPVLKMQSKWATTKSKRICSNISAPFLQSISANVAILPLCFLFFGFISVISPLVNLILLPLITLDIVFGVICCILSPIPFLLVPFAAVCTLLSKVIIALIKWFGSLPVTNVSIGSKTFGLWIAVSLILFAVAYILANFKGFSKKHIITLSSLLCIVMLLCCTVSDYLITRDNARISVLNSGVGTTAVINDHGNTLVIGTGGSQSDFALERYMNKNNVKAISMLIIPSAENKYSQNAANVVKWMQPKTILMDNDGDRYYAVKAVNNSEIKPLDNATVDFSGFNIKAYNGTKSAALLVKYKAVTALFVDKNANVTALPDECKNVDVLIIAGAAPKNLEVITAQNVIFCTNRNDVKSCANAKCYYKTNDNSSLCVVTNGINCKFENR